MNTDKRLIGGICGTLISSAGMLADIESIVSIICAVVGLVITIVTCVVVPVWKKVRDAKKDGAIDPDEAEDIANTMKDGIDRINDKIKKEK